MTRRSFATNDSYCIGYIPRKNINQDHHQVNRAGDEQTDKDTNRKQVIEKQHSTKSTNSLMDTLVTLLEDFNDDMEEIKAFIPHYEDVTVY